MNGAEEIDFNKYLIWIKEGKSFNDVRENLKSSGFPDDKIKDVIAEIDNALLENVVKKEKVFHGGQWNAVGKVSFIISACSIILFFFIHSFYILGFGLTFLSAGIAFNRMSRKLKESNGPFFKRSIKRKINLRRH